MKNSIITILLLAASLSLLQAAPNASITEALTKASQQEILTQSIAKSYLCVVLAINKEKHHQLLDRNIQLFDYSLKELQSNFYNRAIKEQLIEIEELWNHYKFICKGDYNEGNALLMLELNTTLLQSCQQAVVLLKQHASNNKKIYKDELPALKAITASAQQKTLMQRMVLYTLAQKYGLGSKQFNEEKYSVAATAFTQNQGSLGSPQQEEQASWATFEQKLSTIVNSTTTEEQAVATLSPLISLADAQLPLGD